MDEETETPLKSLYCIKGYLYCTIKELPKINLGTFIKP